MLHSSLLSTLGALAALAVVLGLILLSAKLLRVSGLAPKSNGRLQLQASLALDPRRRLCLIRADNREFLLLLGGQTDLVLGELGDRA